MLGKRSWRDWRNQWVMNPRFQRWAAAFPLTRSIARFEARAMFDVVAGFVYSQLVLACLRLGLLERLRSGAVTEAVLQAEIDLPPAALRTLLRAAAALEVLEVREPGDAINRESPDPARSWGLGLRGAALLGNPGVLAMIEHHAMLYADLVDPLAMFAAPRGSTALARYWPYAAADSPAVVAHDSTRAYTRLMSASQQLVAGEILDAYDVREHRCVLDVGGGDGTFLRAVAARAPAAQLMLFDLPGVADQAQAAFAAAGLATRCRVVPGDFSRDSLPRGADLITFVRVLHDHDDPRVERMLRMAYEALPPGGRLVVAEPMAGTAGAARMGDAYFGVYLWAMGSGRPRTIAELTEMLSAAGFSRVRRRPTRIPLQTSVLVAERK
ncbi:MAG: methyltransferase domain-containing protein [Sinobacteraceae bacterium]|nr:methyltransferase domain-containing protein [Nevskiaceae bacterium]